MKKAVITILGLIKPPIEGQEKAQYYFSDELKEKFSLKKDRYTNMLPVLVDNFRDSYGAIESIYTVEAKKTQSEVLVYENLDLTTIIENKDSLTPTNLFKFFIANIGSYIYSKTSKQKTISASN